MSDQVASHILPTAAVVSVISTVVIASTDTLLV